MMPSETPKPAPEARPQRHARRHPMSDACRKYRISGRALQTSSHSPTPQVKPTKLGMNALLGFIAEEYDQPMNRTRAYTTMRGRPLGQTQNPGEASATNWFFRFKVRGLGF